MQRAAMCCQVMPPTAPTTLVVPACRCLTLPLSSTTIWSASMTVLSRCATINLQQRWQHKYGSSSMAAAALSINSTASTNRRRSRARCAKLLGLTSSSRPGVTAWRSPLPSLYHKHVTPARLLRVICKHSLGCNHSTQLASAVRLKLPAGRSDNTQVQHRPHLRAPASYCCQAVLYELLCQAVQCACGFI